MSTRFPLFLALILAAASHAAPAQAWWFEDDGTTWPVFDFHRYGGDVNRPPITPDRPYFHGDDAVPLGMRWRDLQLAEAEAARADAAAAAAAVAVRAEVVVTTPRVVRRAPRHRHVVRRRPVICVPAKTAATP